MQALDVSAYLILFSEWVFIACPVIGAMTGSHKSYWDALFSGVLLQAYLVTISGIAYISGRIIPYAFS